MKIRIAMATLWLCSVCGATAKASNEHSDINFIERKKTIVKSFEIRSNESLGIDNRHGDVKVQLWDKSSVNITITIVANAPSESGVDERINAVTISEKRSNNGIRLQTTIASAGQRTAWSNRRGENSLRVDYLVMMPKTTPLSLKNSFGNTDVVRFQAPLTAETHHGNFIAGDLVGLDNEITVAYGGATIGRMEKGKLNLSYAKVNLAKVKTLELSTKFGSLSIDEVGSINANISYASTTIGKLNENGTIRLSYANGFSIRESTAETLTIQAAYSSVVVPAQNPATFDVSVSYGGFQYPTEAVSQANKSVSGQTKKYEITIGREKPASTVKITSRYGNVKVKD